MEKEKEILSHEYSTMVNILRWRAVHQPEKLCFTYLIDGETHEENMTYAGLDKRSQLIAAMLQSTLNKGDCALLLFPPGLEFIAAFMGCLYAGVIAIPAYPPRNNNNLLRLQAIAKDAKVTVALTTRSVKKDIQHKVRQNSPLASLELMPTDNVSAEAAQPWHVPEIESKSLAFLQYTSGATGLPKGVMVSHGNLLHNGSMMKERFGQTDQTIIVNWLPLFHDLGLIGNMFQTLYLGVHGIFMSPVAFIQKPFRWLHAISRYNATFSGGPNFAYDLCAQNITPEQKERLDLSCWVTALTGAEPVRAETLERFYAAFASCGLRKQALYPGYGMAEATLMISGGDNKTLPLVRSFDAAALEQDSVFSVCAEHPNSRKLVGCGQPGKNQHLVIVNPKTCLACRPGQVGEIWLQGPSVTRGYWQNSGETQKTFHACLADTKEGPYLRTGDLGFFHEGELFITGRLKDLVILRGRNHYPQHIEQTVEQSHPALRGGGGAAFSIEVEGEERLVIVHEVQRRFIRRLNIDEVAGAIRKAVLQEHDLRVFAVELLKPASIAKTSSGKVQRCTCKLDFLAKRLASIGRWQQNAASGIPVPGKEAAAALATL